MERFIDCIHPINNRVYPDPSAISSDCHDSGDPRSNFSEHGLSAVIDLPVELDYAEMAVHSPAPNIASIPQAKSISNFLEHRSRSTHGGPEHRRRIRRSLFHVWDNQLAMKLFGTRKKIQEEQERQESISHWVIHPCSKFRLIWDIVMLVILAINVIFLPVAISFFEESINPGWITFNIFSDTFFVMDIILNFWTGIITKESTVYLDLSTIRRKYFKSWFLLDLIAVLPFDYIALIITQLQSMTSLIMASRALRIIRLIRLLTLLKLLRVARFMRYLAKWEEFMNTTKSLMRIFNLLLFMMMLAHWNGCIQFLIPYVQDFPHNSWVIINRLRDQSVFIQYTWSVFKAASHMICIGYGRFPPQNTVEVWITIISMLIGASFYAILIGHISTLVYSVDSSSRQYNERIKQVEEYMKYRGLPPKLQEEVHEYYYHKYHGQLFDEENILNDLSHPLKERIVMHNCQDLLKIVPFFEDASEAFINCMTTRLKFEVFLPGDHIIRQGTFGTKMYFIKQGSVDVLLPDGQLAATLSDGSYFGEICLLMKCRRIGDVKAVSICDMYALSNDDFQHVLDQFPNMRIKLEGVASARLAMIVSSREMVQNNSSVDLPATPLLRKSSAVALPKNTAPSDATTATPPTPSSYSAPKLSSVVISTSPLSTAALSTSTESRV